MSKKSNIEYLRDIINDYVGEKHKDEALEFLESIETNESELKQEIEDLKDANDPYPDEPEYDNEIDTGFPREPLYWKCGNLQIDQMMETLGELMETTSPNEIARRLKG